MHLTSHIPHYSPDVAFLPADFYSLDLLVSPKWGLYANLMAQIISQISSHFIIHYHRRIVEVALTNVGQDIPDIGITGTAIMDEDDNENDNLAMEPKTFATMASDESMTPDAPEPIKSRLCAAAFKRPHRGDTDKLVARRIVSPMLVFLAIFCIVLIIVGCIMPTYSVSAYGIVGVLVESGQKFSAAETSYSVFTTISLLFEQARLTGTIADFIGLGSLSVILLLSVLVVPIAQSLVLLVQWFVPLTRKRRHRLMILLEILQAWQYAEIYLLAIIVGSWQLGPISAFMINPYCSSLKGFFSDLVYYGILKDQDAQCFQTDVQVLPMFYLLFAGTIALALLNSFVMRAITQYVRDSSSSTLENRLDVDDIEGLNQNEQMEPSKIHPVPVLFTDRYRWLLQREDTPSSSQQYSESFENSDIMKEPSYADSADNMEDWIPKKTSCNTESGNKNTAPEELSFDDGSIYTCTNTNEPNWKN